MTRHESDNYGKRFLHCQLALEPWAKARADLYSKFTRPVLYPPTAMHPENRVTMELTPEAQELDAKYAGIMSEIWSRYFPEQETLNHD